MADRNDVWTFHAGWALLCFVRLVRLSWRICRRTRGRRLLYGDTLTISANVTFNLQRNGDPEPEYRVEPPRPLLRNRSLH